MSGSDHEQQVSGAKDPKGTPVTIWEVERPESIGAKGATGLIYEVRDAAGKRVTHSDSIKGLEGAGYVLDVPEPEEKPLHQDVPGKKTVEEEPEA